MAVQNYLHHIELTNPRQLKTLVENRRVFNLDACELNVFESYQQTYRVPLTFSEFVITSMVRGKKIMHLEGKPAFDYMPGESVIVPANETMVIDFPEADSATPTQCIALAVDAQYVNRTLQFLNDFYTSNQDRSHLWKLQFNQYHFSNDNEITGIINKLIRVCSATDKAKDIYADLNLKELLIRLVQSQHLQQISEELTDQKNSSRLHYVLHYIQENISGKIVVDDLSRKAYLSRNEFFKWFREQFGITPVEYINRERIKLAKQLLSDKRYSTADISAQCGFNDVNYFVRIFKKIEGITPGAYRDCLR